MSLHAQLSTEAQSNLAAQRRNSTLTSLLIALLTMTLIGVILLIIAMGSDPKTIPLMEGYISNAPADDQPRMKKITNRIVRKPAPPSRSSAPIIASNVPAATAIPISLVDIPNPEIEIGRADDFGSGTWGKDGSSPGSEFNNIPDNFRKRCSHADRMQRLLSNGGNAACEDAVLKSLHWLKNTQNKNGSWTNNNQVGMTGLALLTYLGHCETAQSPEFGESVLAAITYLSDIAIKNQGKIASDFKNKHWPYEHAIATYALAEAYTLCVKSFGENIYQLDTAVQAAGQFLINSQHQSGGWDYAYQEDSTRGGDVSIVGWHVQALKACQLSGIDFQNLRRSGNRAIDYLEKMQLSSGAIGYSSAKLHAGQDGTTLAAVGALCAQVWTKNQSKIARKAVRFLDQNLKLAWHTPDSDLYGHYYAVQAMINHGGPEWERYNKLFRDQLLANQAPDGSFLPLNNGQKGIKAVAASFAGKDSFATHYRTCLATLMLESYYRFLPASQSQ